MAVFSHQLSNVLCFFLDMLLQTASGSELPDALAWERTTEGTGSYVRQAGDGR